MSLTGHSTSTSSHPVQACWSSGQVRGAWPNGQNQSKPCSPSLLNLEIEGQALYLTQRRPVRCQLSVHLTWMDTLTSTSILLSAQAGDESTIFQIWEMALSTTMMVSSPMSKSHLPASISGDSTNTTQLNSCNYWKFLQHSLAFSRNLQPDSNHTMMWLNEAVTVLWVWCVMAWALSSGRAEIEFEVVLKNRFTADVNRCLSTELSVDFDPVQWKMLMDMREQSEVPFWMNMGKE